MTLPTFDDGGDMSAGRGGHQAGARKAAPARGDGETGGWPSRILWFVMLWLAGVATVSIVAFAIHAAIMP